MEVPAYVDLLSRSPEVSCVLSADQHPALTAAQSLLPTGSDGSLASFWKFLFAMPVFYHIVASGAIANRPPAAKKAHLRFSPMRFEIGNNQNNFQKQLCPTGTP